MENTRNLNEKPSWLELPEEEKINHTYWYCTGASLNLDKRLDSKRWINLFHSQEEAEAHASLPNSGWSWDKKRATSCNLKEYLFKARSKGYKGIKIKGFKNGEWVILKDILSGVPLL
jgi:hypothetical protein